MRSKLAIAVALTLALLGAGKAGAQANAANYSFSTTTAGSLTDMSSGTTQLVAADQDDTASAGDAPGLRLLSSWGSARTASRSTRTERLRFGATAV